MHDIDNRNVSSKKISRPFQSYELGSVYLSGKTKFDAEKFHIKDDKIVKVSCGEEHSGVLTESGRIFMLGGNSWGQLGLGHTNNVDRPSCVKSLKHEKAILIACGRNHTLIASETGYLYAFGCNSEYQLGLGESLTSHLYDTPQKVQIEPNNWKCIAGGSGQSCALTEGGDLYVWGTNDNGELGIDDKNELLKPKMLLLGFRINYVSCGYYHTAIITTSEKLFTCGSNEADQLGHKRSSFSFNQVDIPEPVNCVACGAAQTVVTTNSGKVYAFGDHSRGQLGLGTNTKTLNIQEPQLVESLARYFITYVACGESHTAFISNKGYLFTSGNNSNDRLGLNKNVNQFTPVRVDKYRDLIIKDVSCGGSHTVAIGNPSDKDLNETDSENDYELQRTASLSRVKRNEKIKLNNSQLPPLNVQKKNNYQAKLNDSEKSDSDSDLSQTFNRTHTLTKDKNFVPLSEVNLKKYIEDEERKKNSKKTIKPLSSDDEKYFDKADLLKKNGLKNQLYSRRNNSDDESRSHHKKSQIDSDSDKEYKSLYEDRKKFGKNNTLDESDKYKTNRNILPLLKPSQIKKSNIDSEDNDSDKDTKPRSVRDNRKNYLSDSDKDDNISKQTKKPAVTPKAVEPKKPPEKPVSYNNFFLKSVKNFFLLQRKPSYAQLSKL